MKKKMVVMVVGFILLGMFAWAQKNVEVILDKEMKKLDQKLQNIEVNVNDDNGKIVVTKTLTPDSHGKIDIYEKPYIGIYLKDLTLKKARELNYNKFYGILITGIVSESPANYYRLIEDDILMEINGEKVWDEDTLDKIVAAYHIGDKVKLKIFRNGQEKTIDFMFGARDKIINENGELVDKDSDVLNVKKIHKKGKKEYSVGHGGGSWIPVWYKPDVTDINNVLSELGFKSETFSEKGFLLQGGGGKGNVGKGWFVGGMGAGYDNSETTKHEWIHFKNGIPDTAIVSRKANYKVKFGGVTLDKRFAFSEHFVGSFGFLLGGGYNSVKISQTDDNGEIPNYDFDNGGSEHLDDYYDYVSKLTLKQNFLIFQPKVMFMYHFLDWLGIRAEAGYILSYSSDGWKAKRNGESVKIENEPDSNMNGLTLSIGPWLGF